MADINTAVDPSQYRNPYGGAELLPQEQLNVPRAQLQLIKNGTTIAATGVGDNQRVTWTSSLPVNFSYALVDLYVAIYNDTAGGTNGFSTSLLATLENGSSATTRNYSLHFELHAEAMANVIGKQYYLYRAVRIPKLVMVPYTADSQCKLTVHAYNATANDGAYGAHFHGRLLEYTLRQALHFQSNVPIVTR